MDSWLALGSGIGECAATQVAKLTYNIMMADVNEASLFTGEGVFDRHVSVAAITVLGHVERLEVLAEAYIVPKLLHQEDGAIEKIGQDLQKMTRSADTHYATTDSWFTVSDIVDKPCFNEGAGFAGTCDRFSHLLVTMSKDIQCLSIHQECS